MSDVLEVKVRKSRGTRAARRERSQGLVPAILFGHEQENVALTVQQSQLEAVIRHGSRIVGLTGDVSEDAMISDVQWDPYGSTVLHLDLTRVSADERVTVSVSVELKGESPGVKQGGMLNIALHEVEIECAARSLPDHIVVNIGALDVNGSITAGEIKLPEGVAMITPADAVVVQCNEQQAESEEEAAVAMPGEPEVIGRSEADEEAGD